MVHLALLHDELGMKGRRGSSSIPCNGHETVDLTLVLDELGIKGSKTFFF